MFALSQMIDIPTLFRQLDELPSQLKMARQDLLDATNGAAEANREEERAKTLSLEERADEYAECRNAEQREQYKAMLFMYDASIASHVNRRIAQEEEVDAAKAKLHSLQDQFSAISNQIRLVTALQLGRPEQSESVLLRRLLDLLREYPATQEATLESEDVDLAIPF